MTQQIEYLEKLIAIHKENPGEIKPREGRALCPQCHGTGWGLFQNTETKETILSQCDKCCNGQVSVCPHCGKLFTGSLSTCDPIRNCNCEEVKKECEERPRKEMMARFERAEKITLVEAIQRGLDYLTDPRFEDICYRCDEIEDHSDHGDFDYLSPKFLWATEKTSLALNANSIVECGCEELHEDAWYGISDSDLLELQGHLDKFCERNPCTTIWPDYGVAVLLEGGDA